LEIMVKIGAGAAMDEPYNCACGRSTPGAQKACLGGLEAEGVMGSIEVFGQARSGAV